MEVQREGEPSVPAKLEREMTKTIDEIEVTENMMARAKSEAAAVDAIIEALRHIKPDRRWRVLRAASVLLTGEDL